MVKFNPKVANKFTANKIKKIKQVEERLINQSRTPRDNERENFRQAVMFQMNKKLFDLGPLPVNLKTVSRFAYFSSADVIYLESKFSQDIEGAADHMIEKFKDGYQLYLDDERNPDGVETPNVGSCIVVRTVERAKEIVERFGPPEFMHLDYQLEFSNVSTPFVLWFIEKYTPADSGLPEYWGYHVHSHSEHGKKLLNKLRYTFDSFKDNPDQVTVEQLQERIKEILGPNGGREVFGWSKPDPQDATPVDPMTIRLGTTDTSNGQILRDAMNPPVLQGQ